MSFLKKSRAISDFAKRLRNLGFSVTFDRCPRCGKGGGGVYKTGTEMVCVKCGYAQADPAVLERAEYTTYLADVGL